MPFSEGDMSDSELVLNEACRGFVDRIGLFSRSHAPAWERIWYEADNGMGSHGDRGNQGWHFAMPIFISFTQ